MGADSHGLPPACEKPPLGESTEDRAADWPESVKPSCPGCSSCGPLFHSSGLRRRYSRWFAQPCDQSAFSVIPPGMPFASRCAFSIAIASCAVAARAEAAGSSIKRASRRARRRTPPTVPAFLPRRQCRVKARRGALRRGDYLIRRQFAGVHHAEPDRQERHLVQPARLRARLGDLLRVPVALERLLVPERRYLHEVELVVLRAQERPVCGAIVERGGRCGPPRLLELVASERRGVPEDLDDDVALVHAPTSAWIAPGPSSVLPRPSSAAPTRMAILPRCLFSRMSWCASPTPSKPIVRHSTGRMAPCSISSLALEHSYALAKCDPMICFWRIQR